MHFKLSTGSCRCLADEVRGRLDLISGSTVEVVASDEPIGEMRELRCIELVVDGQLNLVGYSEIDQWLNQQHVTRVADKHTQQLHACAS